MQDGDNKLSGSTGGTGGTTDKAAVKERVLSGMQPSGLLHVGNLVGALQNWVKLQHHYDCYYFVADWHALTSNYADPAVIREYTQELVLNFLAAGLDPDKCTVFVQSAIPQHAELYVLLSMITPLGWLQRVPTYKEKQFEIKDKDLDTYGFLGYPVLQSADILAYRAKYVPVGIDQQPHLEFTRELARRFNFLYPGDVMVEPEALLTDYPKVVGLDGRKMSKSYNNCIYLSDTTEEVQTKIRTMMTDPARVRRTDKGDPELSPVYQLHKVFSTKEQQQYVADGCRNASIGCIDCKKIVTTHILTILEPIWARRKELKNSSTLTDILNAGNARAARVAQESMQLIREAMRL
ncbi:MAG: tryptophan--tRNA ligase [Nitrospirae bacterium]|uniref:tryptophan--tRNA ligase n=1 Tax=Candidatus Magnetobacterium casense TaxID=1455061 RepID=UPI0009DEC273|nr:tryptophan--tRNA ligase [Candidatus Magnetobacterium casensis]MBF0337512.1 tryptophan--tRNA ligase [Nitrospirota bacterium]